MVSGVCYLSAEKHHLPLLLCRFIHIFNTIFSFKLKPLYCAHVREHVKSDNFFQYFHMNMYLMFTTKGKNPYKNGLAVVLHLHNLLTTYSLLTKLLLLGKHLLFWMQIIAIIPVTLQYCLRSLFVQLSVRADPVITGISMYKSKLLMS